MSDPARETHAGLRAIALFEAGKGVLALGGAAALVAVGPVVLKQTIAALLTGLHLMEAGGTRPSLLDHITTETVDVAVLAILVYAIMRLIEGWGLWRHRAWASWLGCIGAAAYVPFEIYALWRHPDWLTWAVLLLNLLIVAVLARDIARRRR
jgi:uncharacterized membrane protein (DUF2068 family)